MENIVISNDINELIKDSMLFAPFTGSTILVTGATGLLGSILIKALLKLGSIKVYANCRSEQKFNRVFGDYKSENLVPIFSDILTLDVSALSFDYVIHGASITDSKTFVEKPVETISIAIDGTRNLLNQCIKKRIKAFLYLSSLEVYGTFDKTSGIKDITESQFGYINPYVIRSSYSEGKRIVETICKSYQTEYNIPIKVVRLCQTFGPGVEYDDNRVFAQFARAIVENKNIILKTKGETTRNYCYTTDAIAGLLTVLIKGNIGEVYNIANETTVISIYDMAQLFCNYSTPKTVEVIFDIEENEMKLGYNPVVKIKLNTDKIQALGWNPRIGLKLMIKNLIDYYRTLLCQK